MTKRKFVHIAPYNPDAPPGKQGGWVKWIYEEA